MANLTDALTGWYVRVTNMLDRDEGQGLVEYALIIAVVGVMLVGALVALKGGIQTTFNNIQGHLTNGT